MKCMYCNTELKEGSVYCERCGKEAQIVQNIEAFEDEYLTGILEKGQQKKKPVSDEARRKKQEALRREQEKKKKMTRLIIFSVIMLFLIVIGVAIGFYVKYTIDMEHANSYDYQLSLANNAYASGDIKGSIVYYENALRLEPNHRDVRLKLANIYYDRKDYDSALLLYLQTMEEEPENKECYSKVISIYEYKNKTSEILALCEKVTNPDILSLFSDYIVNDPTFSKEPGTYGEYMEVSINSDAGHQIFYTTDGSDPTIYGRIYKEPISLGSMGTYTIRAVCVNAKKLYSEIVKAEYVIDIPAPSMPEVFPNGGTFEEETLVAINVPKGCTAYYTWDGTIPNTTSAKYKEEMPVPEGNNILSIMIVDDKTGKWSDIYRGRFVYYPVTEGLEDGEFIDDETLEDFVDDALN